MASAQHSIEPPHADLTGYDLTDPHDGDTVHLAIRLARLGTAAMPSITSSGPERLSV